MKSENIGKESDVLRQIVKASDAIRKKHRALKTGRETNEQAMHEAFKPIVDPLEKLVNVSHAANNQRKTLLKNEVKEEIKDEIRDDIKDELLDEIKDDMHFKHENLDETSYSERGNRSRNDSYKSAYGDEFYSDDEDDANQIGDHRKEIHAPTVEANELINRYLALLRSNQRTILDCSYGVRILSEDKLMIGNAPIDFQPDTFFYVENTKYDKTIGLIELLFKKEPDESLIKRQDLENYKAIIIGTNAHKKFYRADESIRENKSFKFKKYIANIIGDHAHVGEGMPQYKVAKKDAKLDYVYWDDPNELINRLRLLLASQAAGNSSHTNEIMSIIEELREAEIIY